MAMEDISRAFDRSLHSLQTKRRTYLNWREPEPHDYAAMALLGNLSALVDRARLNTYRKEANL